MVDRVVHHELKIESRGIIVDTEEWHFRGPGFGGNLGDFWEFRFKAVFIESDDVFAIADVTWHGIVVHFKFSAEEAIEEPDFRGCDVPGEFERAAGIRVGTVGVLGSGHRSQDAPCGAVFLLHHRQKDVGEKFCLLGRHVTSPFAQTNGSKPSAIPVPDSIGPQDQQTPYVYQLRATRLKPYAERITTETLRDASLRRFPAQGWFARGGHFVQAADARTVRRGLHE